MRVVITGASGFLGATVSRRLTAAGVDCLGVARTDAPELHRVDSYSDAPSGDCLIHCAETNDRSVANAGGDALEAETLHTLEALIAKGYRHVVYASSAVLYGDRWMTPRGVYDPVVAVDTYTRIKQRSEQLVLEHGGVVARLANLYGPGMAAGNVLSHILGQIGSGRTITMYALEPVRDFLWIEDAALAMTAMIAGETPGVFNVGSGRGTSIDELVDLVQEAAETRQNVVGVHALDRSSHLVLDISATTQTFGWTPQTRLEEGVRKMVNMKMQREIQ